MSDIIVSAGGAALAGGVFGLIAYFKNKKQETAFEGFNVFEFSISVIGSAAIGGIAAFVGVTPDEANITFGPFLYQLLHKLIKAV